jgi:hypothetical protein
MSQLVPSNIRMAPLLKQEASKKDMIRKRKERLMQAVTGTSTGPKAKGSFESSGEWIDPHQPQMNIPEKESSYAEKQRVSQTDELNRLSDRAD